jgi:thioredoxin 1
MLERLIITLIILAGLGIGWFGWRYYKIRLAQVIQPLEVTLGAPTLLYFGADYCAPCKFQQTPIVDSLAAKWGEAVVVKKYDITRHPELASQYKVLTLPTTIVLDDQGQVRHINYGVTPQTKLESQLAI